MQNPADINALLFYFITIMNNLKFKSGLRNVYVNLHFISMYFI